MVSSKRRRSIITEEENETCADAAGAISNSDDNLHLRRGNDDVAELAEQRRCEKERRRLKRLERKSGKKRKGEPACDSADPTGGAVSDASRAGCGVASGMTTVSDDPENALRDRWREAAPNTQLWDSDSASSSKYVQSCSAPGALPIAPQAELNRCARFQKLRTWFKDQCLRLGLRKPPFGSFERWHFCWLLAYATPDRDRLMPLLEIKRPVDAANVADWSKLKKRGARDEGIRTVGQVDETSADQNCNKEAEMDRALVTALISGKGSLVTHVATELCRRLRAQATIVAQQQHQQNVGVELFGAQKEDSTPVIEVAPNERNLDVRCEETVLKINTEHYEKLRHLHKVYSGCESKAQEFEFHKALFSMLLRYKTLGGGGYQAALGGAVFAALLEEWEADFECFASPLNCRYGRYCSAFQDTDWLFGSVCYLPHA
eukprot:SAG31_NODE_1163_length_9588_cov_8.265676_5_plen_433_part_00